MIMARRGDMDPIPVTPVSRANREWTARLARRAVVGIAILVAALFALNAVAAALGYGSF